MRLVQEANDVKMGRCRPTALHIPFLFGLLLLSSSSLSSSVVDAFQGRMYGDLSPPLPMSRRNHVMTTTITTAAIQTMTTTTLTASSSETSPPTRESSSSISSLSNRRWFLHQSASTTMTTSAGILACTLFGGSSAAWAGIDVSGLPREGGGGGNSALATQLKAYDGSGATRVREIQALQSTSSSPSVGSKDRELTTVATTVTNDDSREPMATWAYRANPGFQPSLTRTGPFGNLYRLNDIVEGPSKKGRRSIGIQFEFPNDWLQLDRNIGGIQYVDQRNGDKLYVLRAPLPADTTLETLSKTTLGEYIFHPKGSLVKSGQNIEDYKVSSSQILSICPDQMCATRLRFKIKYATVTGNGLRVERRALVDAYQIDQDIYMLMTSSNAVKFDQKDSLERETVENIVNSFQIDV